MGVFPSRSREVDPFIASNLSDPIFLIGDFDSYGSMSSSSMIGWEKFNSPDLFLLKDPIDYLSNESSLIN